MHPLPKQLQRVDVFIKIDGARRRRHIDDVAQLLFPIAVLSFCKTGHEFPNKSRALCRTARAFDVRDGAPEDLQPFRQRRRRRRRRRRDDDAVVVVGLPL